MHDIYIYYLFFIQDTHVGYNDIIWLENISFCDL